jgi:hypothetical protein
VCHHASASDVTRSTVLRFANSGWGKPEMTQILLVQGANLTFLGRREPAIYGTTTPAELDAMLQRHASKHDYILEISSAVWSRPPHFERARFYRIILETK